MTAEFSLYVHIPFCAVKCRYCDFYSMSAGEADFVDSYIGALCKEWEFYEDSGVLDGVSLSTVYIGGGTPSILGAGAWGKLCGGLFSRLDRHGIREWSVECNPESFTIEKARMYAGSGVTRLTFGVQSLDARELSLCGRAHSAKQALEVLNDGRLAELFESIGVDIIYALPGQTAAILDSTLSSLLSIPQVKHVSAYELTIAEGTPFGRRRGALPIPPEESVVEMYDLIGERCRGRGMAQYEVSNYALPGFESAHNKAYWAHKPYIGLGASAHSYIHPKRWGNIADAGRYISTVSANIAPIDFEETLTSLDLSREIIFLGLRNKNGIDEENFVKRTGIRLHKERLQEYADSGLLKNLASRWFPTSKGMLFADMMARELAV